MDPRHPQHPFSRNAASSYTSHAPFQSTPNPAAFPTASDPRNAPPFRPDHQRRTSENNYFPQPTYARDSAPMPNTGHSRTTSSSSIGAPLNRNMPPPSSPQQQQQQPQQQQQQQQPPHAQAPHTQYPPPPPSRQPAPAIGPPTSFPTNRDLPSLSSIHRPNSINSSMSISSMLGGPSAGREPQAGAQYPTPPAMMPSGAPSGPTTPFTGPMHASPRLSTAGSDYDRFRRPQTPDHHRLPQSQLHHDRRATSVSAGSPQRPPALTPEAHRYSTPQAYPRNTSGPLGPEERRDEYPGPVRVPNPNAPPPRPSSQPAMFNQAPREREASISETVRSDNGRSQPGYIPRPLGYGNRDDIPVFREQARIEEAILMRDREREREQRERERDIRDREYMRERERDRENRERERERERERDIARERERQERQERERDMMRERERERDRMDRTRDSAPFGRHDQPQYARQYGPQPGSFGGRVEPEQAPWMRRPEEQPREPLPQQAPGVGYEFPRNTSQPYGGTPGYQDARYPPRDYRDAQPQTQQLAGPQYGSPVQERERIGGSQPPQQQYPGQQGPFRPNESPRSRSNEEIQQMQRGVYLGIQQEINRKGRNSPFPQAVQGAQGPPTGEPGIKSEFGKMFFGIGSGVGSMATAGGASGGSQTPFSQPGPRRDDLEGVVAQDSPTENGFKMARETSRGGRRRKLQVEDSKEGDDSSAVRTPTGRSKRQKQTQQHAAGPLRHGPNDQRPDPVARLSSPSQPNLTPIFRHTPGPPVIPSPPPKIVPHHHHINRHHHHHHHGSPHPKPIPQTIVPKPKQIVKSNAVLESVAHLPRKHLGHFIYEATLKPGDPPSVEHLHLPRRGFTSTSKPLPRMEGNENCTLTVRVPRVYLSPISREEITARRGVWGTDIYSDDSDVIAACIHGGWIRGEWPEDVDISALDLIVDGISGDESLTNGTNKEMILTSPPARGPMVPPRNKDLHVTVLILPALEKYNWTTRWGIKSRGWKKSHDGLSYMIQSIKFVDGVDTSKEMHGKGRRMRIDAQLMEDDVERDDAWAALLEVGNGHHTQAQEGIATESFVRGDPTPVEGIVGLGMGSWWKKVAKKIVEEPTTKQAEVNGAAITEEEEKEKENVKPQEISQEQDTTKEEDISIPDGVDVQMQDIDQPAAAI